MRNLILFIIGSILFLGCANLTVAQKYYQQGEYNKSYKIYNEWAKRGFSNANLKLSSMANSNQISKNSDFVILHAKKAYKNNIKKAANILFETYYKNGDINNSKIWFDKVDLNTMSQNQIKAYITFLFTYINKNKKNYINKIENFTIQTKNPYFAYQLAKVYETTNIKKSIKFYKLAYEENFIPAGINLALLYIYKLNKEKKGLKLLQKLANKDNGETAYIIAKYFLAQMDKEIQKLNNPCVSLHFTSPKDFFIKKTKISLYKEKFLKENILPWFNYSYKKGYIPAKLALISLDLDYNNFNTHKTLSNLTLNQAIKTLELSKLFKAKMILARIFETYPNLHRKQIAKQIYSQYIQYNKLDAYWHLYQFEKRFYPNSKEQKWYLQQLLSVKYLPAIIENAYINNNKKLLSFYAEQNNTKAITYLASLYSKNPDKTKQKIILDKLCTLTNPINPILDLKIAKLYKDINKSATIYQYYANQNIPLVQFKLSKLYENLNDCNKSLLWLKKAKSNNLLDAQLKYYSLVLKGKIDDNISVALNFLNQYQDNPSGLTLLGDIYAQGIYKPFNPKKAISYYKKATNYNYPPAFLHLINIYNKIDINGSLKDKIIATYKKLIQLYPKNIDYKLMLAQYYYDIKENQKAIDIIIKNKLYIKPAGKYLLYALTGELKQNLTTNSKLTQDPNLLLLYAKKTEAIDKNKALYYAFLASLKGNVKAPAYIVKLLKKFNSTKTVDKIYLQAKKDCNLL